MPITPPTVNEFDYADWAEEITDEVNDLTGLAGGSVPESRTISTTAPLSGGGDLSTNRTLTTSMATDRLIGRTTASTGVMEELTVTAPLDLAAGTLTTSMATDKLIGRGSASTGVMEEITLGSSLDLSSTTLNAGVITQRSSSTATTTVMADQNGHLLHPAADDNPRTFTIDSNANVAYPIGTTITFINEINTLTIAITSDTLVFAGDGDTGSRELAADGMATAIKITSTKWMIAGSGLS